jgi:hypothetical protein
MSFISIITSSPDTVAPLLPRSTNRNVMMAPDNPDEWPYHYLKREIIELKKTVDVLELWTLLQVEFPPEDEGLCSGIMKI